jgi:pimeloyl-ACP methyl ester carboxylesterase
MSPDSSRAPSIYDRLWHSNEELCSLLATGTARRELAALFGAADYALLTGLARAASRTQRRHPETVYLLPGIMGTQLGALPAGDDPADLIWLDPQDVMEGGLYRLRLPQAAALVPLGALPFSYLSLQLRLRAAGFTVYMHDYDWRLNLTDLSAAFLARLRADPADALLIVAHSMGGLIARSALGTAERARLRRLVTLGTPHGGSYGAVQALRGTYPVVRRLAALDPQHDAEALSSDVFNTFPSIHQMVPGGSTAEHADLFDIGHWPSAAPRPDPRLLQEASDFRRALASADERCIAIAGTQQRTVTGLRLAGDEFHYQISNAGDGTVPLASAQLPGCSNYYVRCEHIALPRSATVACAVLELLRSGRTSRLAAQPGRLRGRTVTVRDAELRGTWLQKIDWAGLAPGARRDYLNDLNEPPRQYAPFAPAPPGA